MTQQQQQATAIAAAVSSTIQDQLPQQTLFTVEQMAAAETAFSEAALRNLIFKAEPRHSTVGVIPGNGLIECGAIVRVGRKVLINRAKFLDWVTQ